jgi:hypothetical protein
MLKNKTPAVFDWLLTWPELDGYLKLNAILAQPNQAAFNVVPNEAVVETFIDGTARRRYTFQLKAVLPWSDGYDGVNADADRLVASWHDWVAEQYRNGNVPLWEGAQITDIRPTENAPGLNFVYQDEGLAEYVFEAVIDYEE